MIGWLDATAGVSGDMLLGALVDAGVPLELLQAAVDAVGTEPVRLRRSDVVRAGIGACKVDVDLPSGSPATRTWSDVRGLLEGAALEDAVRGIALDVFARLAAAEGAVHRVAPEQVHFHEVGALDAVADVVGAAAGLVSLGLTALTASPLSLGSGTARGAHGPLPVPVPVPAVLQLLTGVPVQAGAAPYEQTTPTGAALVAAVATGFGPLPAMAVHRVGTGAGGRDPAEVANVLRLVLGEATGSPHDGRESLLLLESTVDDLDPRLWPGVLDRLLAAGARDAWLTPVLMKKGRPGHVLSVLADDDVAGVVRDLLFRETTTLGVREQRVGRTSLDRRWVQVLVDGHAVRVKLGLLRGEVVNAVPEWADVAAAAAALGRPAKQVLAQAQAAAAEHPG